MAGRLALFLLISIIFQCFAEENSVVFETKSGRIEGKLVPKNGKTFGVFQAIPYAEAPIGPNRFKDPVAKKPWSPESLDASRGYGSRCQQLSSADLSEDCLLLNVFTPKTSAGQNPKYPVMLFIHGGAFKAGSANDYPEDGILSHFVDRDVVFVSINYRLGALGFWTTRSCAVPGNMGFKDQRLALVWVREHIAAFGGDPDRVTIFGESAGAMGCDFLTLSPTSTDLFSQAILQSNSAMSQWATMKKDKDEKSVQLARALGCLSAGSALGECQNDQKVLGCMQGKTTEEILTALNDSQSMDPTKFFDGRIGDNFLPEDTHRLAETRRPKNIMLGTCKDEWAYFEFLLTNTKTAEDLQKQIPDSVRAFGAKNSKSASAAVKFEYVESQIHHPDAGKETFWFNQAIQMKSAINMRAPLYENALELLKVGSKVYLYSFDYLSDSVMPAMEWRGVGHGSELMYQFNMTDETEMHLSGPGSHSAQDYWVQDLLSLLWTNFAKYGNPTPEPVQGAVWEPLEPARANYLSLDDPPQMKDGYNWRGIAFWNGLIRALDTADGSELEEGGSKKGIFADLLHLLQSILNKF